MKALNRRTVLASTGTALTGMLAGCSAPLSGSNDRPEYVTRIAESVGELTDTVSVWNSTPEGLREDGSESMFGPRAENIDTEIHARELPDDPEETSQNGAEVSITLGDFEKTTVEGTITSDEWELDPSGEYGEYQLYGENQRLGVKDGVIILASTTEQFEATVDAREGEGSRFVEADDEFASLVDRTGGGDMIRLRHSSPVRVAGEEQEYIAQGRRENYGEEVANVREVRFYEDDATEHEQSVRAQVADHFESFEIEVDGRVMIIEGTTPLEVLYPSLSDDTTNSGDQNGY